GAGIAWVDRSRKTKSAGGQTLVFPDNKFRTFDFNLDFVSETQRAGTGRIRRLRL
ncbi:MAG: hypothetical protein AzoDbin1_05282, partial [Azoarcus sp.]|nr:hypothetical protein [Azoarcus sp.]